MAPPPAPTNYAATAGWMLTHQQTGGKTAGVTRISAHPPDRAAPPG